MSFSRKIVSSMIPTDLQQLQTNAARHLIVLKFGAEWCKPCKLIKPTCEQWVTTCPSNVVYVDIDIDESMDLYMAFKNKKMIRGVPTILAFNTMLSRDKWYIPDFSVEGGDISAVQNFLNKCTDVALHM